MVRHRCQSGELGGDFPKARVHVLVAAPTEHCIFIYIPTMSYLHVIDFLGRRFAETEFLTFLVMVVQQWKIDLREDWSRERAWRALEDTTHVLTLQPGPSVPLVFTRRKIK
jgi:hypothetical protein